MNSRSRQHQLEMEHLENIRRTREDIRQLHEDVFVRGIGTRRLQLIHEPAFQQGYAWDIRQQEKSWNLYRSSIKFESVKTCLVGYDRLVADPATLNDWFQKACKLNVSMEPDLSECTGCDGETFKLTIFGDLNSMLTIRYWCEAPEQWKPIQHFVDAFRVFVSECKLDDSFPDCLI